VVYLSATVSGFLSEDESAWLQEDLLVSGPDGGAFIDLLNVINRRYPVGEDKRQELVSNFLLPLHSEPGIYTVHLKVRDRLGNRFGETTQTFLVR
jgi:hypothetical protein